jgi:hypothetical protein
VFLLTGYNSNAIKADNNYKDMTFPESPHLAIGDATQVGILTLWTKKEHVMAQVDKSLYAVCAQLYSRDEGISNLIRSLLQHKEIRDIVLVGADLNQCAPTLTALWENGSENGRVIGAPGYIDPELPKEAINNVRKHVTIHDLQHVKEYQEVAEYIKTIEKKPSYGEPETYPQARIEIPKEFPYAPQHVLLHTNIQDALIELARRHQRFHTLHNVQITIATRPFTDTHTRMQFQEAQFSDLLELALETNAVFTINIQTLQPTQEIDEYAQKRLSRFKQGDPASNLLIRLHDNQINVTHLSPDGKRLETFADTSAYNLLKKIGEEFRISDINHALYIGYELARAEKALNAGELYEQDQP